MENSLSVVIVAWNSAADLSRTLPALAAELEPEEIKSINVKLAEFLADFDYPIEDGEDG